MLAIKNSAMKNAFYGVINKQDMANEAKKYIKRTLKKSKESRNGEKEIRMSKDCGTTIKDVIYVRWEQQKRERKRRNN